jgi:hypothetical protein
MHSYGGKDDWFLPSSDELDELYQNKGVIGGFGSGWYWSSSEFNHYYTWAQRFSDGAKESITVKDKTYSVRAIRAF